MADPGPPRNDLLRFVPKRVLPKRSEKASATQSYITRIQARNSSNSPPPKPRADGIVKSSSVEKDTTPQKELSENASTRVSDMVSCWSEAKAPTDFQAKLRKLFDGVAQTRIIDTISEFFRNQNPSAHTQVLNEVFGYSPKQIVEFLVRKRFHHKEKSEAKASRRTQKRIQKQRILGNAAINDQVNTNDQVLMKSRSDQGERYLATLRQRKRRERLRETPEAMERYLEKDRSRKRARTPEEKEKHRLNEKNRRAIANIKKSHPNLASETIPIGFQLWPGVAVLGKTRFVYNRVDCDVQEGDICLECGVNPTLKELSDAIDEHFYPKTTLFNSDALNSHIPIRLAACDIDRCVRRVDHGFGFYWKDATAEASELARHATRNHPRANEHVDVILKEFKELRAIIREHSEISASIADLSDRSDFQRANYTANIRPIRDRYAELYGKLSNRIIS